VEKWEMYMEIDQLRKQGFSKAAIARKLGISRTTVYRYLNRSPQDMAEWVTSLQTRAKKLDKHKELILSWLREHADMSAAQVFDWLVEKYPKIEVGESTVRDYVRGLREEYDIPKESSPRDYEAVPDPPMGEQMQVDFGETKVLKSKGNETVKLRFISFVLSNSRYKFMYGLDRPFTTNDVVKGHELAFQWFDGIPNEIVV